MLEHPVIFDTMYKIMTFGYGGPPIPGQINPFDPPDDFFRIRLIATLLETCGMYFNKGTAGKKLDYFLSFFQYYIYTKNPLPMDIEFLVQDIFALTRPQWKLASNLEEATKAFQLAIKSSGLDKAVEQDDQGSGVSSDDDANVEDGEKEEQDGDENDGEDEDEGEDDENAEEEPSYRNDNDSDSERGNHDDDEDEEEEEEEAIVVTREEEEIDPEWEAEFDREYAKIMAESYETRKFERKQFDIPLPVRPKNQQRSDESGETGSGGQTTTPGKMAFSLLTKKGNRQQTKTVELPSDSSFAVAMINQRQAAKEEQQRIKNLVLNYDLREEEEDDDNDKPISHHHHFNRSENRNSKDRGQRVRKLQLSDVDW